MLGSKLIALFGNYQLSLVLGNSLRLTGSRAIPEKGTKEVILLTPTPTSSDQQTLLFIRMEKLLSKPSFESTDIHEPLLEDGFPVRRVKYSWLWRNILGITCAVYVVVSAPLIVFSVRNYIPQPYSPANHLLSYQRQQLYFGEDSKYSGLPEDVDEAWDSLLEPINIRVTKQELQQAHAKFGDDIVRLTDGDYVSVLSVHHELHCLDALRRNIFRDYYYANATVEETDYNILHLTHCADTIRRSLMCKADLAIYTAYWIGDHKALPSKELRSESDTVCVNWEAIDTWSRKRLLPKNEYKVRPGPFEKVPLAESRR
ncbi:hypothetical protein K505DRAFT_324690, partial [Melanomma pulvis-pyrius CBS 109.77]